MAVYDVNGATICDAFRYNENPVNDIYDVLGNMKHGEDLPDDPYIPGRLLLFEDNFNSMDSESWTSEVGPMRGILFFRENNATIENGKLVLTIKKEQHGGKEWTTGSLTTRGKRSWMYGRFEAKIKMPEVHAYNSAFWFLGNSAGEIYYNDDGTRSFKAQSEGIENVTKWPACGEIDVVETIPGDSKRPQCNLWGSDQKSLGYGEFPTDVDITKWHIYAMEWTKTYMAMYIDNIEYKRWVFSDFNPDLVKAYTTEPMAILLTMGITGWMVTTNTPSEGKMYIDWVRVYAEGDVTEKISAQSISMQETMRLQKSCVCYTSPIISPLNTSDRRITWISEDESIVKCDNGFIYGLELGETNIYAITENGRMTKCHVVVVEQGD